MTHICIDESCHRLCRLIWGVTTLLFTNRITMYFKSKIPVTRLVLTCVYNPTKHLVQVHVSEILYSVYLNLGGNYQGYDLCSRCVIITPCIRNNNSISGMNVNIWLNDIYSSRKLVVCPTLLPPTADNMTYIPRDIHSFVCNVYINCPIIFSNVLHSQKGNRNKLITRVPLSNREWYLTQRVAYMCH